MIIVSELRSFSVRSATTRSLSAFCMRLLGWASAAEFQKTRCCQLSLGDWACLGGCLDGLLRQFLGGVPRPRRVDVDAGDHRGGERDLLGGAALRGRRLRANELVDQSGVCLNQRALSE